MTVARDAPRSETRSAVTLVSLVEIRLIIISSALIIGVFGMAGAMILLSILLICLDEGEQLPDPGPWDCCGAPADVPGHSLQRKNDTIGG
jgi:hypothetical protein